MVFVEKHIMEKIKQSEYRENRLILKMEKNMQTTMVAYSFFISNMLKKMRQKIFPLGDTQTGVRLGEDVSITRLNYIQRVRPGMFLYVQVRILKKRV